MPEMDGAETFVELRKERPDVRVVLMSGYDEGESTAILTPPGAAGFLSKPFQLREVVGQLRKALDG